MDREYGIGRIPADVDPIEEQMAQEEARRLTARARRSKMVKCACGHTVPRGMVMSASLGSSCPDCYDRMSD